MIRLIKRLYFAKPRLARLLFGKDPDSYSVAGLKSELLWLRVYMWLWVVVVVFVVFGVLALRGELSSCMDGLPLKAVYDALSICQSGQPLVDFNISLGVV